MCLQVLVASQTVDKRLCAVAVGLTTRCRQVLQYRDPTSLPLAARLLIQKLHRQTVLQLQLDGADAHRALEVHLERTPGTLAMGRTLGRRRRRGYHTQSLVFAEVLQDALVQEAVGRRSAHYTATKVSCSFVSAPAGAARARTPPASVREDAATLVLLQRVPRRLC